MFLLFYRYHPRAGYFFLATGAAVSQVCIQIPEISGNPESIISRILTWITMYPTHQTTQRNDVSSQLLLRNTMYPTHQTTQRSNVSYQSLPRITMYPTHRTTRRSDVSYHPLPRITMYPAHQTTQRSGVSSQWFNLELTIVSALVLFFSRLRRTFYFQNYYFTTRSVLWMCR